MIILPAWLESLWQSVNKSSINALLLTWILIMLAHLALDYFHSDAGKSRVPKHPDVPVFQQYTRLELSKFNGVKEAKILLGADGKVFDVTPSKHFYGPGGPYSMFAGRDCTLMLARQDFDITEDADDFELPISSSSLSPSEQRNLSDWLDQFHSKYICIGELVADTQMVGR